MGKYIINIEHEDMITNGHLVIPLEVCVQGNDEKIKFNCELTNDMTPYTEPDLEQVRDEAYQKGYRRALADVREEHVCQTCVYFEQDENEEPCVRCPRNFLDQYTPKQEQEEIQVGDEVIPRETEYDDMIVTRLWKDDYDYDYIDAIGYDGRTGSFLVSRVSKTGKHYEIAEVLAKIKE